MRVLMTGASGFMGAALLARAGIDGEVVTLGRAPVPGAAGHVVADLSKPGDLEAVIAAGRLPDRVDAVVHLAVSRLHRGFPDTAGDMFQVNVASTAALLDYARRAGASWFLYGSTGTVYHPFPRSRHAEEDTTAPGSWFGWSKLAGENAARLYEPHFGVFVPRFFVPYGPGQAGRMVDGVIDGVIAGRPVTIPLDGPGITSAPIYLDDALDVLRRAIQERWTGTLNVAGEEALPIEAMAAAAGRVVGRAPVIERRAGASGAVILPDVSRLKERVDVAAFVPFEEGVRRTLAARDPAARG